jgi:hypothetical protein
MTTGIIMIMGMITNIRIITGTTVSMFIMETAVTSSLRPRRGGLRKRASRWLIRAPAFVPVAAALLGPVTPASSQTTGETLRVENEYRECLYSKSRSGRYANGQRESDFGLLGECRNQWVAYMDVCTKTGLDNATCVMKSRLVIHAILNLTGK